MIFEKIRFMPDAGEDVRLDAYLADPISGFTRKAMLVIPGGGYGAVCSEREGEPIAHAFLARGFNAFVLHYTVGRKKTYPAQLIEASRAMVHIRENAREYGIDPDAVVAVGFSAGGHLAGCLGTMWNRPEVTEAGIPAGMNRPNGIMLVYPVVTGADAFRNEGTIRNLWCTDTPTEEMYRTASIELAVDAQSSPLFLVHTSNDQSVDVRNSLILADAYRRAGLLFEMHIYPDAPHGVALGNDITRCGVPKWSDPVIGEWVSHAARWAERFGDHG